MKVYNTMAETMQSFVLQGEVLELESALVMSLVTANAKAEKRDISFLGVPLTRKTLAKGAHSNELIRFMYRGTVFEVDLTNMRRYELSKITRHLYRLDFNGLRQLQSKLAVKFNISDTVKDEIDVLRIANSLDLNMQYEPCSLEPIVFNVHIQTDLNEAEVQITAGNNIPLAQALTEIGLNPHSMEKMPLTCNTMEKGAAISGGIMESSKKYLKPRDTQSVTDEEPDNAEANSSTERKKRKEKKVNSSTIVGLEEEPKLIDDDYTTPNPEEPVDREPSMAELAALEKELQSQKPQTPRTPFVKPTPHAPTQVSANKTLVSALLTGVPVEAEADKAEVTQEKQKPISSAVGEAQDKVKGIVEDVTSEESAESVITTEAVEKPENTATLVEIFDETTVIADVSEKSNGTSESVEPSIEATTVAEDTSEPVNNAESRTEEPSKKSIALVINTSSFDYYDYEEAYLRGDFNAIEPIALIGRFSRYTPEDKVALIVAYIDFYYCSHGEWMKKHKIENVMTCNSKHDALEEYLVHMGAIDPPSRRKWYSSEILRGLRNGAYDELDPIDLSGHLFKYEQHVKEVLIAYCWAERCRTVKGWCQRYGIPGYSTLRTDAVYKWLCKHKVIFDEEVHYGWLKDD